MGYLPVPRLNRMPSKNRTRYSSPVRRRKRGGKRKERRNYGKRRREKEKKKERRSRGDEDHMHIRGMRREDKNRRETTS